MLKIIENPYDWDHGCGSTCWYQAGFGDLPQLPTGEDATARICRTGRDQSSGLVMWGMEMRRTWENRGWHLCPLRIVTSPTSVNLWYAFKHSGFSYFTCVHWFIVFMESQGQPIPVIAPVSLVEWRKSTGSLNFHGRPQAHLCHWPCLPIAATPKSRIGQRCRAMLQCGRGRQLKDATKIWRKQQEASFEASHNKALSIV